MRIYDPINKGALDALRNSGITLILDTANDRLGEFASNPSAAASWVQANVRPYYPAVNIKYIAVGNEVEGGATQSILPAMRNIHNALIAAGLSHIKVSTSIKFNVIADSYPPSAGRFAQPYIMYAIHAALEKAGAPSVRSVVSESGWPSAGGSGASIDNARKYNQGLINHVDQGTPKNRQALETYVFAMFNENQKPGDATEKHFGLLYPNMSLVYPIRFA
ncbi:hypothetical protein QOZ80_5BG0434310 [Eleusine coracana subsp. coracana]|nr:hypothetical protein QOZ80_5BG0434310 [Eleusine coracana subsp. coracana]